MIIISHRANLNGPDKEKENSIHAINKAIQLGYDCEIDVWMIKNEIYLGHDAPIHLVDSQWFNDNKNKLWCHAKNFKALDLLSNKDFNCFWHEKDKVTITSKKFLWYYPSEECFLNGINVMPEINNISKKQLMKSVGICTDYAEKYKRIF